MKAAKPVHVPCLLHLIAVLFVLAAVMQAAGVAQTFRSWNWLLVSGYYPHPLYAVFTGSLFSLIFITTGILLWLRFSFAPRLGQLAAGLVFIWYWVDRLLLSRVQLQINSHLIPLIVSVVMLIFLLFSLWLLEPFMKSSTSLPEDESME